MKTFKDKGLDLKEILSLIKDRITQEPIVIENCKITGNANDTIIKKVIFNNCSFEKCNFWNCQFLNSSFLYCSFIATTINACVINDNTFFNSDFMDTKLSENYICNARFNLCCFAELKINNCYFKSSTFFKCDFLFDNLFVSCKLSDSRFNACFARTEQGVNSIVSFIHSEVNKNNFENCNFDNVYIFNDLIIGLLTEILKRKNGDIYDA